MIKKSRFVPNDSMYVCASPRAQSQQICQPMFIPNKSVKLNNRQPVSAERHRFSRELRLFPAHTGLNYILRLMM